MSLGCGTLATSLGYTAAVQPEQDDTNPSDREKDLIKRRVQNSLPVNPKHAKATTQQIKDLWSGASSLTPTTLWGTQRGTDYGGTQKTECEGCHWEKGNYYNRNSNIRLMELHDLRRNAASSSHDVHRFDQRERMILPPAPGDKNQEGRQCISGVMSPDCCFLEAFGFDLGLKDRQGRPIAQPFRPNGISEQFRSVRSYKWRDPLVIREKMSLMRKSASAPLQKLTLRPEEAGTGEGGEGGAIDKNDELHDRTGWSYGARSCHGWDSHDHAAYREAAKMSHSVHGCDNRSHPDYIHDRMGLRPAAVYTKRYRKWGEDSFRDHEPKRRVPGQSPLDLASTST